MSKKAETLSVLLPLAEPTRLHFTAANKNQIEVRTSVGAHWLGLPALVLLPIIVISGLLQVIFALWMLEISAALIALLFTSIGVGLLSLLVISATHERLRVTPRDVEWTLRLLAVTLRRKTLLVDRIDELEVVDVGGSDGTCWKLELRSQLTTIFFGQEPTPAALNQIGALIDERRGK